MTRRRAPSGAYAIRASGKNQYTTTIPPHIAAPIYEADLALTYEVVKEGLLIRLVPMSGDINPPAEDQARALVERVLSAT